MTIIVLMRNYNCNFNFIEQKYIQEINLVIQVYQLYLSYVQEY